MRKVYLANAQINMTDYTQFSKILQKRIDEMQNKGMQVEVQYCPCSYDNYRFCCNALILGYKMEEEC